MGVGKSAEERETAKSEPQAYVAERWITRTDFMWRLMSSTQPSSPIPGPTEATVPSMTVSSLPIRRCTSIRDASSV